MLKGLCFFLVVCLYFSCLVAKPLENVNKNEKATALLNKAIQTFRTEKPKENGWYTKFVKTFTQEALQIIDLPERNPYGYYQCIPEYLNSLPNTAGASVSWDSPCFGKTTAVLTSTNDQEAIITVSNTQNTTDCQDFYAFGTLQDIQLFRVEQVGSYVVHWNLSSVTDAERWDINMNGFRLFKFLNDAATTIEYLIQTFELFIPELKGPSVPIEYQVMNIDFLRDYPQFPYPARKAGNVALDPSEIRSGDFFGITRLDGLDPMIIFGMGGTTGHTATALWIDDELYVCESTVSDVYWPTNGVQKTPYNTWIEQAHNASFMVVHVPLSDQYADMYNATAALEFFNTVEGLNYGFHNFLFGWLDTPNDNFPCLPPDYSVCLSQQLVQVASGVVDVGAPSVATLIYNEAFNLRIQNNLSTTAEIYQYAYQQKNLTFGELFVIPEQDSWVYSDGKNMVCDVFVCFMWKAAGLFGDLVDQFQCTELTPFDVYRLNFFDTAPPPEICSQADPDLPYCQLMGRYELDLYKYNTVAPYANMAQTCPGLPPNYTRPINC